MCTFHNDFVFKKVNSTHLHKTYCRNKRNELGTYYIPLVTVEIVVLKAAK